MKFPPDNADPAKQEVLRLAADLAKALKSITRDRSIHGFENLINAHPEKFSDITSVHRARKYRNCIAHDEPVTDTQLQRAEAAFDNALKEILKYCPESLRNKINQRRVASNSTPESENCNAISQQQDQLPNPERSEQETHEPDPPRESSATTAEPPKAPKNVAPQSDPSATTPPQTESHPKNPSRQAAPSFTTETTPEHFTPNLPFLPPIQRLRSGRWWFVLAGAFLFVAGFAYILRSNSKPVVGSPSQKEKTVSASSQPDHSIPAQPAPLVTPSARQPESLPPSPAITAPRVPSREDELKPLINAHLSLSSSQRNVGFLIESKGTLDGGAVAESLQGLLGQSPNLRLIGNIADVNALAAKGLFDELYGGNALLITQAARLSGIDYILLGKASYSFRSQPELNVDLKTCDLTIACKLADRAGTIIQSGRFAAIGPGFTEIQALEHAAQNAANQLKDKLLTAIP